MTIRMIGWILLMLLPVAGMYAPIMDFMPDGPPQSHWHQPWSTILFLLSALWNIPATFVVTAFSRLFDADPSVTAIRVASVCQALLLIGLGYLSERQRLARRRAATPDTPAPAVAPAVDQSYARSRA